MDIQAADFGQNFVWGCATAAFQTEGAWELDSKGASIWDVFSQTPGKIHGGDHAKIACDFYYRYEEDLGLLKSMQFDHFRFSISWPRILPNGTGTVNEKGLDFYQRLTDHCLEKNITPWATCYHWDLPYALEKKGGWTNRDIVSWFGEYVSLLSVKLGDRIKNWMVLNEPMAFVGQGYGSGYHAPGKKSLSSFLHAVHHAVLAQSEGGRILRSHVSDAKIGTTFSCSAITPFSQSNRDKRAARTFDALYNRIFIEPAVGLGYPTDALPALRLIDLIKQNGDDEKMPFDFDFIGIQNYYRIVAKHSWWPPTLFAKEVPAIDRNVAMNNLHFEIYPEGLYLMLKKFAAYPTVKEIIITENGVCFDDPIINGRIKDHERISFFEKYLKQAKRAKEDGVPLNGYFVWSLTDNFEWTEGYKARFGLIHIDFDTQKRTIKESGRWWQQFLKV